MSQHSDWKWSRATGTGSIAHKFILGEPVPFWVVKLPTGLRAIWYRLLHACTAQTVGVIGWEMAERCICGAVRFTDLPPTEPRGGIPSRQYPAGPWIDRNRRFGGDVWAYLGGMRPIDKKVGGV